VTKEEREPVRIELQLRHRDLDALGHVNQAVFHELLEEARGAFFRATLPDLPFTGYVLAHVELDYRREVRIDDRYLVGECRVASLGRSRVELENRLVMADGTVAVEGRAVSSRMASARRCCPGALRRANVDVELWPAHSRWSAGLAPL
jgi:acyl-CoA thioester hydrolase